MGNKCDNYQSLGEEKVGEKGWVDGWVPRDSQSPGMEVHSSNPSSRWLRQEKHKFKSNLVRHSLE